MHQTAHRANNSRRHDCERHYYFYRLHWLPPPTVKPVRVTFAVQVDISRFISHRYVRMVLDLQVFYSTTSMGRLYSLPLTPQIIKHKCPKYGPKFRTVLYCLVIYHVGLLFATNTNFCFPIGFYR